MFAKKVYFLREGRSQRAEYISFKSAKNKKLNQKSVKKFVR